MHPLTVSCSKNKSTRRKHITSGWRPRREDKSRARLKWEKSEERERWSQDLGSPGTTCLDAMVCLHTSKRICGFNPFTNEVRRFLDLCDLLEFNCEYKTFFEVAPKYKCRNVPPL